LDIIGDEKMAGTNNKNSKISKILKSGGKVDKKIKRERGRGKGVVVYVFSNVLQPLI
jgi:hypothetical protein